MSLRRWFGVGFIAACAAPALAWAHPGHGLSAGSHGFLHYVTEPLHATLGLAAVGIIMTAFVVFKRRRQNG